MLWLLVLHIAGLVFWSAMLLYLPALIAGMRVRRVDLLENDSPCDSLVRFIFTRIATPAALITILAGTLIFVVDGNTAPWLIVKLTLVAMLVLCHTMVGVLVLRLEESPDRPMNAWCTLSALTALCLQGAIIWLVLAKPSLGGAS